MSPTSRCVILVPVGGAIDPGCEDDLRELERRGYPVWRVRGYAAIDAARNQLASDALAQGFDELMWIDSDVVFDAGDVDKLRRHDLPLVCGIYPKKSRRQFACSFLPHTAQVQFGVKGGLLEILYCGFGFVLTRRSVYETMQRQRNLPLCNQRFQSITVPYFAPLVAGDGEQAWYLGEDYAFCERARQCGFRVMADTSIRLWHVGSYRFGWEDAGRPVERYHNFTFHVTDAAAPVGQAFQPDVAARQAGKPDLRDARQAGKPDLRAPQHTGRVREPARNVLQETPRPLPATFPRLRAYCVSYPANQHSLRLTLEDFRQGDWGEEPTVFVQPDDWPKGKPSASRNYRRVLEHAYEDGCDFALILEDDVRVNRRLRHNLTNLPLIRRDQCDYLSLFMPDLIVAPWLRNERHLGYRLTRPLYAGPNQLWERHRIWGSQGYVLSRRFLRAALERWDHLKEGQDTRVMVVCCRILRHTQDAEDAFQAAFLVLARKAATVAHRQALSSWLYRVAYRIAVDAKTRNDKRRAREKQMDELPHPQVLPAEPRDWRSWLDHELNLLPERYRAVLVTCDLEERSRKEAARLLGLAEGTVSSRLARGRSLLAKRLSRYGLSLSGGTLAAALSSEASAALPLSLTSATMLAATGTGVVSASVGVLTKGALKAMLLTKLKWTVGVVMVAVALGATGLAYRVSGQPAPAAAEKEVGDKTPTELEILRREIELLKLKLEVVQEKQKAQEMELRALRATADGKAQLEVDHFIRFFNANINLKWPKSLQRSEFEATRERVNAMMKVVYKSVTSGNNPRETLLIDLLTDLRKMQKTLDATVDQLSPEEFIEANRYLRSVKNTITALKAKAVPSGRQPAGEAKPKAQQPEADLKHKVDMLRKDLFMWQERAVWSERMSQPGRQYVTPAQAEADKSRLRSARLALRQMEIQLHLQEAETALKALRAARDPKAKQRAMDELEKALKKLREQVDKQEGEILGTALGRKRFNEECPLRTVPE